MTCNIVRKCKVTAGPTSARIVASAVRSKTTDDKSIRHGAKPNTPKLVLIPEDLQRSVQSTRAEYRQLGRSGLRVSNPILGGVSIGDSRWFSWILNEDKALPLLKDAYDRGINTWDTANIYSNGESERIMGKALREYCIPRRKVVIMTKIYRVVCDSEHPDPGSGVSMHTSLASQSKDYVNQWGLSRAAIFSAVDASLERLGTGYIDVLQIHRFDPTVPPEETMLALHDLVRSGKVRYLGASSMWCYQFAKLQHIAERNGWSRFVCMQNHYNLLYREEEREMLKYCRETGVGIIPWSPLASGKLARPPSMTGRTHRSTVTPNGGSFYHATGSLAALASAISDSKGIPSPSINGNSDMSSQVSGVSSPSQSGSHQALGVPELANLHEISDHLIIERVQTLAQRRGWSMSQVALAWLNARAVSPVVGLTSVEHMDDVLGARGKQLSNDEEQWLEELYLHRDVIGHE